MNPVIRHANEPREKVDKAIEWLQQGYQVALLTLVSIDGNAPYPIGSQMLVRDDGVFDGQLTGGCVEAALAQQAISAMKVGQNVVERYGLGSRFFDIQLPCGSGIDVDINVTMSLQDYQQIQVQLNARQAAPSVLTNNKRYLPTQRLLLFGTGPIVTALTELASCAGFDVLYFDHQQAYELQPYCDAYTALVSLFHEHDFEINILAQAVTSDLFYIGALGSRRTHAKRLQELASRGLESTALKRIHGPVGHDIHAQTPPQIAVSIVSEIIHEMNSNGPFSA